MNWNSLLSTLGADTARYFSVPGARVELLSTERRQYSDIAQVRVRGDAVSTEAFIKVTRPQGESQSDHQNMAGRVQHEFDEAARVHRAMGGHSRLGVVRPLACIPEKFVLITERAPGRPLDAVLETEATGWPATSTVERLSAVMASVAEWLRTFHRVRPVSGRFDLDGMREYLDIRLVRLVANRRSGFDEADREAVLAHFDDRRRDVAGDDLTLVAIHADLAPGNVLVHGDKVTVLDFAMAKTGSVFHDLSRLYSQLGFLTAKPKFRPSVIARVQQALLSAFQPDLTADRPLFNLLLLQHTVTHFDTVAASRRRGVEWLYDVYLRRRHRRWIRHVTARAGHGAGKTPA